MTARQEALLTFLRAAGYATDPPHYTVTQAGKADRQATWVTLALRHVIIRRFDRDEGLIRCDSSN